VGTKREWEVALNHFRKGRGVNVAEELLNRAARAGCQQRRGPFYARRRQEKRMAGPAYIQGDGTRISRGGPPRTIQLPKTAT